jgi:DNA-binding winged helix-turn-helix (wHTH) protein/TolB-like protein
MVEPQHRPSGYRFGVFDLAADPLELRRQGRRIRLRPQSLRLLRLLVEARGEVVPRDRIQRELWEPDVFVDVEQGVNHCIKELRAALRDAADAPRFIETIPRRGYRFVAPIEAVDPAAPAAPGWPSPASSPHPAAADAESVTTGRTVHRGGARRVWILAAATAIAVAAALIVIGGRMRSSAVALPLRIAVLPFATGGPAPAPPYLGPSFADAVIARLARDGDLSVRPTAAVTRYEAQTVSPADIARTLSVDYLVSGTVALHAEAIEVQVAITRPGAGEAVWTGTLSRPIDHLEDLEADVAERVRGSLRLPRLAATAANATNPAAHRAYLEGRYRLARLTADDTRAAVSAFERALALDPEYAPAHAGLAIACAQMYIRFGSEADVGLWKARAEQHAAAALQRDAARAEPHEALAAVARYTEFDWERVVTESDAAIRLNPSLDLPHYYIAAALQHAGRFDLVENEIVAGLEANPWNLAEAYRLRGVTALWSGRFAEARAELERVRQLAGRPVSDPHLAAALYYGGDAAAAEAMLADLRGSAQAEQRGAALLASLLAARGDRARARALVAQVESRPYRDHHVLYNLGTAYAGLGETAAALQRLREAVEQGFLCYPWYRQDPLLQPLHARPEFEALLREVQAASDRLVARVRPAGAGRQISRSP